MMTAKALQLSDLDRHIKTAMAANKAKGVQVVGEQIVNPTEMKGWGISSGPQLTEKQQNLVEKGAVIFNELCVQCHGADGTGTSLGNGQIMAPPLTGSSRVQAHPEYTIKTILRGLEGPIEGKTYPGAIMVGMQEQSDEWIAAIASYIRLNLTNEASLVSAEEVAKVREKTTHQKGPYRYDKLIASVPQELIPGTDWKITASHTVATRIGGTASPKSAFNFEGWSTGEQQKNGMWFQIELPKAVEFTEIHFNSPPVRRGPWRNPLPSIPTYPIAYEVEVSLDGKSWKTVLKDKGVDENTHIAFMPEKGRFLRIRQTGDAEKREDGLPVPWNLRELKVYAQAGTEKMITSK
jgi:mono/diheme cytochrome c family protein